jgi:hypothetical protein
VHLNNLNAPVRNVLIDRKKTGGRHYQVAQIETIKWPNVDEKKIKKTNTEWQ